MGDDMQRIFYIPEEKLLDKHSNIPQAQAETQIASICKAIRHESNNSVTVQHDMQANRTVRFTIQGQMDRIQVAMGILERRLTKERRQDQLTLPQNVVALTIDNLRAHNQATTKQRQFACGPCQNIWWRKVFVYKPVSRCNRCHVRYDPVPLEQMYGWGRFSCPQCKNVFWGRAQYGVASVCYGCQTMVLPDADSIGMSRPGNRRFTGNIHACAACNNGAIRPCPAYNRVLYPSTPHVSTGSTASTFLTQQSHDYRDPMN
ncbi:shiftless antiviral inhibitor of ribosomal frameshifting protein homolog [Asterias rubens]|uniref:shiftless antiviral inhibitor of ribosomal frameshifting protein homolog n=1 Tax=Asterias rubens TaxID=7604 RepID=UPI0014554163|nr:shiftless antiviral inhibitor of ribosomal frameshifting protein homolog [Asterias rubens]